MSAFESQSVFARLKAARKSGKTFIPAAVQVQETIPAESASRDLPLYESVFDFSRRCGIPAEILSDLIAAGDITYTMFTHKGAFLNVRKALADLEHLEHPGRSQREVA